METHRWCAGGAEESEGKQRREPDHETPRSRQWSIVEDKKEMQKEQEHDQFPKGPARGTKDRQYREEYRQPAGTPHQDNHDRDGGEERARTRLGPSSPNQRHERWQVHKRIADGRAPEHSRPENLGWSAQRARDRPDEKRSDQEQRRHVQGGRLRGNKCPHVIRREDRSA